MAIIYHHVLINENEADQLFNELDVNRLGLLDYDVFLSKLMVFLTNHYSKLFYNNFEFNHIFKARFK
jgi:hypothetical protein